MTNSQNFLHDSDNIYTHTQGGLWPIVTNNICHSPLCPRSTMLDFQLVGPRHEYLLYVPGGFSMHPGLKILL